jgi:hypothetical protein
MAPTDGQSGPLPCDASYPSRAMMRRLEDSVGSCCKASSGRELAAMRNGSKCKRVGPCLDRPCLAPLVGAADIWSGSAGKNSAKVADPTDWSPGSVHHSSNSSLGAGRSRVAQTPGSQGYPPFSVRRVPPKASAAAKVQQASRWIDGPKQGSWVHEHAWGCTPSRGIVADMSDTTARGCHGGFTTISL